MHINKLQKQPRITRAYLHEPRHDAYDDSVALLQSSWQVTWVFFTNAFY